MVLVVKYPGQGIAKDRERLLKGHAMLGKVGCCFPAIPFELQTHSEESTLTRSQHFFKTRKEESKRIFAKYSRQNNEGYLEAGYQANAKLFERVPFATKEGMEIQIKEALARKPGATLRVNEILDDSIVVELEKEGFIDRIYKQ